MNISTDPALLDVELPMPHSTLIESPSVSTFMPDEEAAICPLLSSNCISTQNTLDHPLTPTCPDDAISSANVSNTDCNCKAETSSESSTGIGLGLDGVEEASTNLFNKHNYHHFQNNNNNADQEANSHCLNGSLNHSQNAPSFVSWNWPLIRKCTFFLFMSGLLAMCSIVVAMIVALPKSCNPKTAWYRGSVFYEIFPASFQDSNNDGIGDLRGISNRIDYIAALGISALRLNSIFASEHYPEDFVNATSLTDVAEVIGAKSDVRNLAETLHERNMSLLLDMPLYILTKSDLDAEIHGFGKMASAIAIWLQYGIDGFYLKGLENLSNHVDIGLLLKKWKTQIGPNRILLINEAALQDYNHMQRSSILANVDLVDYHLDVTNGTTYMENRIKDILSNEIPPNDDSAWIHWSIGGVDRKQRISQGINSAKFSLTATIMQLMLPGTPNIFYGDEIAIENIADTMKEHQDTKHLHHLSTMHWTNSKHQFTDRKTLPWLPNTGGSHNFENLQTIINMIALRDRSPSIYKNAICKPGTSVSNTQISRSNDDIIVIERAFPRRNSFVSVTNFGNKVIELNMASKYYSGNRMLVESHHDKIYFDKFGIGPLETIVVKLDK